MPFLDEVNKWVGPGAYQNFFGGQDPSEAANKYIEQIPGKTAPNYQPFINSGTNALPQLQGQYDKLLNDPGGLVNKIGESYHESPGFQFALKNALAGGNRAFAAGGMGGSPGASNWGMETATGFANKDYNNYLEKALSRYDLGLGGEEKIASMGQQAGSNYGDMMAQALAAQAKLKYEGQQAQNSFWPDLVGGAAKAAPYLAG